MKGGVGRQVVLLIHGRERERGIDRPVGPTEAEIKMILHQVLCVHRLSV